MKIYKRNTLESNTEMLEFSKSNLHSVQKRLEKKATKAVTENIQTVADQLLLQHFAPASVMVNSKGDILYITGRTGNYLEPVAGKANWNIFAMAREGLREELPGAMRKAMKDYNPVVLPTITLGSKGKSIAIDVTVQQAEKPDLIKGMIFIVFKEVNMVADKVEPANAKKKEYARARAAIGGRA